MNMSLKTGIAIPLLLATTSLVAMAEDRATGGGAVSLVEAVATSRHSQGKLNGCEMTYLVAFEDHIYRQGGITLLRGGLSVWGFVNDKKKPPAISFKITAFDVQGGVPKLSPLEYAYLSVSGVSYAGKEVAKFASEDGGLFMGYELLKYPELALSLKGALEINFNRAKGRSDLSIPVNISRDKPEVAEKQSQCVLKLIAALKAKFGG